MNVVSFSQHKFHPALNVVTLDGEQVNGLWVENEEEIKINMYAEHDLYDYYGNLLRDYSETRNKIKIVTEWIEQQFKDKFEFRSGWSTKNQFWREWTIKK